MIERKRVGPCPEAPLKHKNIIKYNKINNQKIKIIKINKTLKINKNIVLIIVFFCFVVVLFFSIFNIISCPRPPRKYI